MINPKEFLSAGHAIHGHWDWKLSLILAVAVFIGAQIGARFSIKINKKTLKRAFGWFLVAIASLMVLKTVGVLPGRPASQATTAQIGQPESVLGHVGRTLGRADDPLATA